MAIRATDNETLAQQLWGEGGYGWDEGRAQWVPVAPAEQSEVDDSDPYAGRDFRELQALAKERGLTATGARDELVARLVAADAEKAALQEPGA